MSSLLSEIFLEAENTYMPKPTTIPSGPYRTSPTSIVSCQSLDGDLINLRLSISSFSRSVGKIRNLLKQSPRNQSLINSLAVTARKERTTLKIILVKIRDRVKSGWYTRNGCTAKDIAKATCFVRHIGGQWLTIGDVKKLRDELVYLLRHRRGIYARVDCSRL